MSLKYWVVFLQVVSQNSALLAPLAVDAVMRIADPDNADLNNIKVRTRRITTYLHTFF